LISPDNSELYLIIGIISPASAITSKKMKNKALIIGVSFLAVIICLILTALLFYAVKPVSLIILSFSIGVITGICIAFLVLGIINNIKNKRTEKEKS
jgi:hypothetical protein